MRLSLIFELLLIFVLLAFAASKSIKKQKNSKKSIRNGSDEKQDDNNSINKYCKCSEAYCNCCRDFQVPVLNLDGPGCASLMYLSGDKMSVSLRFGKKVITNRTLSSRKPSPVCMPLPGGISKFCGRVYNIARAGEEFRACLGLELQSKSTVEAAVRVSCFKFGPRGVTSEAADPLPLVPQDEKVDDDDDDDDDDDEDDDTFGLVADDDDDDDDDDDGDLDATNDVESADYTGFSLLGEDILGDLFGTSGGKKSNKNKNKKKQAPTSTTTTTTTTTTKRPRPSRRPSRRPNRTTTPRPAVTRTTTVRVRPVNRRPTRKPSTRRPENRPPRPSRRPPTSTTLEVVPISETSSSISSTVMTPTSNIITAAVQTTESVPIVSAVQEQTFEPVSIVTQRPMTTLAETSLTKDETQFEDPGLEMSLAQLTGQLSVMPVTPILPTSAKVSSMMTTNREPTNYEKIETITPKTSSTVALATASQAIDDDMVQIVQDLDSHSEETKFEKPSQVGDESRSQNGQVIPSDFYGGLRLTKKNKGNDFDYKDLDVIGLSAIGKTVGDELGLFGKNKKHNRNNKDDRKIKGGKKGNKDYDDILGLEALSDSLGLSGNDNQKKKKHRGRQNKMMRGDWDLV